MTPLLALAGSWDLWAIGVLAAGIGVAFLMLRYSEPGVRNAFRLDNPV
jgi:hypothetical protein